MHGRLTHAVGLAQRFDQPACHHAAHLRVVQAFEHDHEFVGAQARRAQSAALRQPAAVALPQTAGDAHGHQAQQLVAGSRTQPQVHAVEAVAVDEQHRRVGAPGAPRLRQDTCNAFECRRAVGQPRELVDAAGVAHFGGHPLAFLKRFGADVPDAGHQGVGVQPPHVQRQPHVEPRALACSPHLRTHLHTQRLADRATGRRGQHQLAQLRRHALENVEQVAELALRGQWHQQLRQHRVDHGDLPVRRRLHQPDRHLVQELHQGFDADGAGFVHGVRRGRRAGSFRPQPCCRWCRWCRRSRLWR